MRPACRQTGFKVVVGATPSRYASGQALDKGQVPVPQTCGRDYLVLAKAQSRKEIVANSLHLPYFGACPAELWVRRGGFFFAQRRRGAKELLSARYDFRRPLRLGVFAACPAELRGALFFFSFFFAQRRIDLSAAADKRKEIKVRSV